MTGPRGGAGVGIDVLREVFGSAGAGALAERMGIEILEAGPDRVSGRMPVQGNTQPYGLLHGGASVVLAETLGSVAAALHAGPAAVAVGVDINATHHRAVREGWVHAVASPAHRGATLATYDVVVRDERDRRVCSARITCAMRPRPSGSGVSG